MSAMNKRNVWIVLGLAVLVFVYLAYNDGKNVGTDMAERDNRADAQAVDAPDTGSQE